MNRSSFILFILSLGGAGCLEPKSTGGGDDDSGGGGGTEVTIYDLQQGNVEVDTQVTLRDVVITTPLTAAGDGFFVQDPAGGPYSGIYVYLQGTFTDLYFEVGDEVTITGMYTEYYDLTELTVTSTDAIEVTGTGSASPVSVSDVTDWEQYEGVLVSLSEQTVEECIDSYGEVALSGGISLDDAFFTYETERGATYTSIIGAVTYNYKEWKLWPRSADDLEGYAPGEGCVYTCAQIQQEGVTGGVELNDVVVTSGLTYDSKGFFVQDQGGGEWSGMFVYLAWKGATADVSVGDVIDVVGSATEYYDFTEVGISSEDAITVTGSADAEAVSLTSAPADWEPYESVLVTLTDVEITAEADHGEVETNYGINIASWLYSHELTAGSTLDAVTGLVSYSFKTFDLNPRDESDLEGGTIAPPETATVAEIQQGDATGTVTVEGVVATSGLTSTGGGFFVQDAGGGPWSGLYVYLTGAAYGAVEVEEGDVLTITGEVTEYYELTELKVDDPADVEVTGAGSPVATPLSSAPSDWEPYEGVLVELSDIGLSGSDDGHGAMPTTWTGLSMGTLFYDWTGEYGSGDQFAAVTGPLNYSWSVFRVEPREAGDLVE